MRMFKVSSPGKLHLIGEYSVIYGKPAIIAAINKRCFVSVLKQNNEKINVFIKNFNLKGEFGIKEILEKTEIARKLWKEYSQTKKIKQLKMFMANPLDFVIICIGETLFYYNNPNFFSSGFTIKINTDIPLGSGMGSSAALATAVAGGLSLLLGENLNKEIINDISFLAEQKMHGFPSGGDNTASSYGGLIWYQKKSEDEKIIKFLPYSMPKKINDKFFAIQTGMPVESTGEMVSFINNQMLKNKTEKEKIEKVFNDQGELAAKLLEVVKNEDEKELTNIIKNGENNLEKLGVVSKSTTNIIHEIEKSNGAAKICGAGGRKKHSGIVLAFHTNPDMIEKISKRYNLEIFRINLGEAGAREEKYE